ncbi:MAG: HPr(Ser) kinase/phosphatase [bacterium]
MNRVIIRNLLEDEDYQLELKLVSGEEQLERVVTDFTVHKLGLALTGVHFFIDPGQVQIMGGSEIAYLQMLSDPDTKDAIDRLMQFDFPCLIITKDLTPPAEIIEALERKNIPCLKSSLDTAEFIRRLDGFLDEHLAPRISFHGVLIDVIGIGTLILGQSGIGKSETALDLVLKGHRLVADDIVEIYRRGNAALIGRSSNMIKFHMEIRGLGIINVEDLFGISATRDRKRIDLVIELVEWEQGKDYDRLGLEEESYNVLGIEVPHLTVPIRPGRNISTIVEVAARNQILKKRGHYSAREFQQLLIKGLAAADEGSWKPAEEVE